MGTIIKNVKLSGITLFALFLVLLVSGSLFASLALHLVDQYFCPLSNGDFCNGVEQLLFHLTDFKTAFLSFAPILFVFLLTLVATGLLRERKRLERLYYLIAELEFSFSRQPLLRWLAIHTNSPTTRF